jgi:virulence-associated protein VapD
MHYAYYNCTNLTGSAACGNKVTQMNYAYYGCSNITKAVIGPKVNMAYCAYYGCVNVRGNVYINTNNITNIRNCFGGRSNASRLNIYIPANTSSSTFNRIINYTNAMSIVGASITWTQSGSYYYNAAFNIYVYPSASFPEA